MASTSRKSSFGTSRSPSRSRAISAVDLVAQLRRGRRRRQPLLLKQPVEQRFVLRAAELLEARAQLGAGGAQGALVLGAKAIERALRDQEAAPQVAERQIEQVVRARVPLGKASAAVGMA